MLEVMYKNMIQIRVTHMICMPFSAACTNCPIIALGGKSYM